MICYRFSSRPPYSMLDAGTVLMRHQNANWQLNRENCESGRLCLYCGDSIGCVPTYIKPYHIRLFLLSLHICVGFHWIASRTSRRALHLPARHFVNSWSHDYCADLQEERKKYFFWGCEKRHQCVCVVTMVM